MYAALALNSVCTGSIPMVAEARARAFGYIILAGTIDKPHGLRECYFIEADGYLWVPD